MDGKKYVRSGKAYRMADTDQESCCCAPDPRCDTTWRDYDTFAPLVDFTISQFYFMTGGMYEPAPHETLTWLIMADDVDPIAASTSCSNFSGFQESISHTVVKVEHELPLVAANSNGPQTGRRLSICGCNAGCTDDVIPSDLVCGDCPPTTSYPHDDTIFFDAICMETGITDLTADAVTVSSHHHGQILTDGSSYQCFAYGACRSISIDDSQAFGGFCPDNGTFPPPPLCDEVPGFGSYDAAYPCKQGSTYEDFCYGDPCEFSAANLVVAPGRFRGNYGMTWSYATTAEKGLTVRMDGLMSLGAARWTTTQNGESPPYVTGDSLGLADIYLSFVCVEDRDNDLDRLQFLYTGSTLGNGIYWTFEWYGVTGFNSESGFIAGEYDEVSLRIELTTATNRDILSILAYVNGNAVSQFTSTTGDPPLDLGMPMSINCMWIWDVYGYLEMTCESTDYPSASDPVGPVDCWDWDYTYHCGTHATQPYFLTLNDSFITWADS